MHLNKNELKKSTKNQIQNRKNIFSIIKNSLSRNIFMPEIIKVKPGKTLVQTIVKKSDI